MILQSLPKSRSGQVKVMTFDPSVELPIGEDHGSYQGPAIDKQTHPAGGHFDPHGGLIRVEHG